MTTIGDLHRDAKVDRTHLYGGREISHVECTNKKCGLVLWKKEHIEDVSEATGGTWGPNGNGYNYWCPRCDTRMNPHPTIDPPKKKAAKK